MVIFKPKIKPQLTPLMADTLSITSKIPLPLRELLIQNIKELGGWKSARSRYWWILKLPLNSQCLLHLDNDKTGDTHLIMMAAPKNPEHNFFKLEYNPSKIDPVQLPGAVEYVLPYPLSFKNILSGASLRRIDLTVDVVDANIESLLFYSVKKPWSEKHFRGGTTVYLGQSDSEKRFRIYDKGYFIQKNNAKKVPVLKEPKPSKDIT